MQPGSLTLTALLDAIPEDLVFLSKSVGEGIQVTLDGSRLIKVHLDKAHHGTQA